MLRFRLCRCAAVGGTRVSWPGVCGVAGPGGLRASRAVGPTRCGGGPAEPRPRVCQVPARAAGEAGAELPGAARGGVYIGVVPALVRTVMSGCRSCVVPEGPPGADASYALAHGCRGREARGPAAVAGVSCGSGQRAAAAPPGKTAFAALFSGVIRIGCPNRLVAAGPLRCCGWPWAARHGHRSRSPPLPGSARRLCGALTVRRRSGGWTNAERRGRRKPPGVRAVGRPCGRSRTFAPALPAGRLTGGGAEEAHSCAGWFGGGTSARRWWVR